MTSRRGRLAGCRSSPDRQRKLVRRMGARPCTGREVSHWRCGRVDARAERLDGTFERGRGESWHAAMDTALPHKVWVIVRQQTTSISLRFAWLSRVNRV